MKPRLFPAPFWLIPLLSLGAFVLGFGAAYRQDKSRVLEEVELARLHLLYTLEMKDDMGLIDWSKSLEGFDDVRAFRVVVNGKIAAEGGNRNRLPSLGPGITYFFPAQWGFSRAQGKGTPNPAEFSLVCQTRPGPLFWGLFSLGACLLPALAVAWWNRKPAQGIPPAAAAVPAEPVGAPTPSTPPEPFFPEEQAVLLFDEKFTIRNITERAARLLQKERSTLLQKHLLDLDPDPSLLNALEKAEEVRLSHPFANRPGLGAVLKPGAGGNLLILESTFPVDPP